jgi:hypothetical protein
MSNRSSLSGSPLSCSGRIGLLAASLLLVAGFCLARLLEPDPRGYGTHQKLGLPECTFQLFWNRPCPGCGMTTAFAYLVRGQWGAAARANPAGVLLGVTCAALIPWMWLSAWRGKTVGVDQPLQALLLLVIGIATANLAVWGLRFWQ